MGRKIKFTTKQLEEMCNTYQQGVTAQELAEEYGVSKNTILRRLREAGCEIRSLESHRINLTDEQIEYMIREYRDGASSREIAEKMDVSSSTVL